MAYLSPNRLRKNRFYLDRNLPLRRVKAPEDRPQPFDPRPPRFQIENQSSLTFSRVALTVPFFVRQHVLGESTCCKQDAHPTCLHVRTCLHSRKSTSSPSNKRKGSCLHPAPASSCTHEQPWNGRTDRYTTTKDRSGSGKPTQEQSTNTPCTCSFSF